MYKNINIAEEFLKVIGIIAIVFAVIGIVWGVLILLGIL